MPALSDLYLFPFHVTRNPDAYAVSNLYSGSNSTVGGFVMSYPDPPLILSIVLIPPNFFVVSDLYENNGTPFAPIAICPIGVAVLSDLILGVIGIRF